MTTELSFNAQVNLFRIYNKLSSNSDIISVSANCEFLPNKYKLLCYYFRCDSLTIQCMSRCENGARLGNVGHVRRQDYKVCGDQMSLGSLSTSLQPQI